MSVKRVRGKWAIDVQLRGHPAVRRVTEARDKPEAMRVEAWVKLQLRAGVDPHHLVLEPDPKGLQAIADKGRTTVQQAFEEALRTVWAKSKSLKSFFEPVGKTTVMRLGPDMVLADLGQRHYRGFVADCREAGDSESTINRRLAIISKLRHLVEERNETLEPVNWKELRTKQARGRLRWLTDEEEAKALRLVLESGRAFAEDMADLMEVLVDTGMRRGEALRLRPQDVDLAQGLVYVWVSKSGRARSVPLTDRALGVLARRLAQAQKLGRSTLFEPLDRERIRRLWDWLRKQMHMEEDTEFVLHALRHTCATRMAQRGVSLYTVQHILGHESPETTEVYAKLSPEDLRRGVATLNPPV